MEVRLEPSWKSALADEFEKPYFKTLATEVRKRYQERTVFPAPKHVFLSFELCTFDAIKVVILGQDPYHGKGQAHGLSFSVQDGIPVPPSLKNIYKELSSDIGKNIPTSGNLEHWAKQGVLLLNATLTVEESKPGSHQKLGWEIFTDEVIRTISEKKENVVFLLWGNYARAKRALIDEGKHLILEAPHPSPLSAHAGFFGSKPFSKTNEYLKKHNLQEIDW